MFLASEFLILRLTTPIKNCSYCRGSKLFFCAKASSLLMVKNIIDGFTTALVSFKSACKTELCYNVRNRRLYRYSSGYRNFASRVRETEYHDSAGIATVCEGEIHCIRRATPQSARKLQHIENPSQIGIDILAATHGKGGVQRPSAYRY